MKEWEMTIRECGGEVRTGDGGCKVRMRGKGGGVEDLGRMRVRERVGGCVGEMCVREYVAFHRL